MRRAVYRRTFGRTRNPVIMCAVSAQYGYEYKYRNGHRRSCRSGDTYPLEPMQGYACEWPDCDKTYKKAVDLERHERTREHDDHTTPARRPSLTHLHLSCISDATDAPQTPASSSTPAECAASGMLEATSSRGTSYRPTASRRRPSAALASRHGEHESPECKLQHMR
jgi:hypothetical protein